MLKGPHRRRLESRELGGDALAYMVGGKVRLMCNQREYVALDLAALGGRQPPLAAPRRAAIDAEAGGRARFDERSPTLQRRGEPLDRGAYPRRDLDRPGVVAVAELRQAVAPRHARFAAEFVGGGEQRQPRVARLARRHRQAFRARVRRSLRRRFKGHVGDGDAARRELEPRRGGEKGDVILEPAAAPLAQANFVLVGEPALTLDEFIPAALRCRKPQQSEVGEFGGGEPVAHDHRLLSERPPAAAPPERAASCSREASSFLALRAARRASSIFPARSQ